MNNSLLFTFTLAFLVFGLNAAEQAPIIALDIKDAKKLEIRHGQLGFRSTLLFYTFKNQKAVMKILINNKDNTFPVTATVFIFDKQVTEDGLKKWLNNQHSDGLFPDVPKPSNTIKIPAKVFKVASKKLTGQSKQQFGNFENYDIKLKAGDYTDKISIKLTGFTVDTKVHVKAK
jgi:hypothetical protein